ncbi:MAG: YceH family protein [Wenzhouxiangella sp.]
MTEDQATIEQPPLDPPLSAEEARVLGCLIEKEATTPEAYPLTQNACVTAANQKTSRHPVMKLDPGRVGQALRQLEQRGLVKSEFGARATRYAHQADAGLELTPPQRALIGLLLLRGPQTLAELFARSERLHRFDDLDEVRFCLDRLSGREAPLVVLIPRGPGQREDRYAHTLTGRIEAPMAARSVAEPTDEGVTANLEVRVTALEERMAALEAGMKMLLPGGSGTSV